MRKSFQVRRLPARFKIEGFLAGPAEYKMDFDAGPAQFLHEPERVNRSAGSRNADYNPQIVSKISVLF